MDSTLAVYVLGGAVTVAALQRLKARLELFFAKHPSLTGHPYTASLLARRLRNYEYAEDEFFGVDGADESIAGRRRTAFLRLAADLRKPRTETLRVTGETAAGLSDLKLTASYRVPFQFRTLVRRHLGTGSFLQSAQGVTVTDLDGNVAYDLAGSYGVNVFGVDFYRACLEAGLAAARPLGPVLGSYHQTVADNVKRLQAISGLDEVSFHMSGTEAVMQAVRLARYHTRKKYMVRFCGAYHGWWDDAQPGVGNPMPPSRTYTLRDMHSAALRVLRTRTDIACVLINPLQALHPNAGAPGDSTLISSSRRARFDREAYTGWLRQVREVCTARGIVLIFDEVFLGFRLAKGGAQEYFGVRADLVTYGKTLGGGLPVGVVCGRGDLMKRFREDHPTDICFARGTFNSHPYVMTAMNEFLQRLDAPEIAALYAGLDGTWEGRARALNASLAEHGLPVQVAGLQSIWTVLYKAPGCYHWMLQFYLRAQGLSLSWVGTGRLIFSLNYTDADFAEVARRFVAAALRMREDGWWDAPEALTEASIHRRLLGETVSALLRRR